MEVEKGLFERFSRAVDSRDLGPVAIQPTKVVLRARCPFEAIFFPSDFARGRCCDCSWVSESEWQVMALRVDAAPTDDRPLLVAQANLIPRPLDGEDKTMRNNPCGLEDYFPWLPPALNNSCPLAKEGSCSEIAMPLSFGTSR